MRIQDATAVVDRDVAQHLDLPGLGVDLDHRDVRPEREGRIGAVEIEFVTQWRRFHVGGQLGRILRRSSQFDPRDVLRRHAGDLQPPSPTTMSSADASSRLAAICLARSSTPSDARWIALPAVCRDREPSVPDPRGTAAVSELTSLIWLIGMPSMSLANMAKAVW